MTFKSDLYSIIPGKKTTRTLIKNDVLEMGKTEENINDYLLFCEHFVPCVIGKILVQTSLGQEKITVSIALILMKQWLC